MSQEMQTSYQPIGAFVAVRVKEFASQSKAVKPSLVEPGSADPPSVVRRAKHLDASLSECNHLSLLTITSGNR